MRVDRLDDDVDDAPRDDLDGGDAGPDVPAELESPESIPAVHDDLEDNAASIAEYREKIDAAYRSYAIDQGCERVQEIEETVVTPAMLRIESEDPTRHLVGLDHCLKGKDRLTEKVTEAMTERARTPTEAFATVKDAIRYTFQYSEDRYSESVLRDCERLKGAGFEPVDRKNCWSSEQYKGVNSRWRVPGDGSLFEVQFHTGASFEAKQATHAAYERLRSPGTSKAEQDELTTYQREVSSQIPVPPSATDIPNYR